MNKVSATLLQCLPVFPLRDLVLLPGALIPLHIFEPRYRNLVAHCLATDGVMGIANAAIPYSSSCSMFGDLHRDIGIGTIVHHEKLADGRYVIALFGVSKGSLVHEYELKDGYRRFRVEPIIDDCSATTTAWDLERIRSLELVCNQIAGQLEQPPFRFDEFVEERSAAQLADAAFASLVTEPRLRQRYIAMRSTVERVELAGEALRTLCDDLKARNQTTATSDFRQHARNPQANLSDDDLN